MVVFLLTLVRHGETTANKAHVIQGHQDTPLSGVGLKQAQLVAHHLQNNNFTHIFASDLSRAVKTAQTIAESNPALQTTVQLDARIRERTFGIFEGKKFQDLFEAAAEYNLDWPDFIPEGAETSEEVRLRAISFFQDLCALITKVGDASGVGQKEAHAVQESDLQTEHRSNSTVMNADASYKSPTEKTDSEGITDIYPDNTVQKAQSILPNNADGSVPGQCNNTGTKTESSVAGISNQAEHGIASSFPGSLGLSDDDITSSEMPHPVGDVLVVSHGGWIKELMMHFYEDFDCQIPGGKDEAKRTTPNTGISRFRVTVSDQDLRPTLLCLMVHNKDHMVAFQEPLEEVRPAV